MPADFRPANCRNRLQNEGKTHPKIGCNVTGCGGVFGTRMCHSHEPGAEPLPEAPPAPLDITSLLIPKSLFDRYQAAFGGFLQPSHIQTMCQIALEEGPSNAPVLIEADIERLEEEMADMVKDRDYLAAAETQSIIHHLRNRVLPRLRGEAIKAHT